MEDSPESAGNTELERNGRHRSDDSPETVLAEVLPGIAVVFGEVPPELTLDLIDFGLVPAADRTRISTFLASVGSTATMAGNLGNAVTSAQGLYRLDSASRAILGAGGTLASKDGAQIGAIFVKGKIVRQARLVPVSALGAAQLAAAIGPQLAMIALQMQLNDITGLARTNIALTSQVLTTIRHEQWAELTALVKSIDRAVVQAREIESVPTSLWNSVAGNEAALRKQLELYRLNVGNHVRQIRQDTPGRRAYLETNAEPILFDAHALLSSLKAWTGYQALHAARARTAGADDPDEARLVDVIARDTRTALESALDETRSLVDALTRELRIIVELPGRATLPLSGKRKDSAAVRQTSAGLLEAIRPLADALHPPAPPPAAPGAVCAPGSLDVGPYLNILRWFLDDGETLRVLGYPTDPDASDPISAIFGGAKGMLAAARDRPAAKTLIAVTDRRVIQARTDTFLEHGEIGPDIPLDRVRYVRAITGRGKGERAVIDLITRDENIRWLFGADVDTAQVDMLAAVLAESMTIPDAERDALRSRAALEASPTDA